MAIKQGAASAWQQAAWPLATVVAKRAQRFHRVLWVDWAQAGIS